MCGKASGPSRSSSSSSFSPCWQWCSLLCQSPATLLSPGTGLGTVWAVITACKGACPSTSHTHYRPDVALPHTWLPSTQFQTDFPLAPVLRGTMTVIQLQCWKTPQWINTLARSVNILQTRARGRILCRADMQWWGIFAQDCGQSSRDLGNTNTSKSCVHKPEFP